MYNVRGACGAAFMASALCSVVPAAYADPPRDPFVSILATQAMKKLAEKKAPDIVKMTLKGIIWTAGRKAAIINDELVMEGGEYKGARVARIDKDSVTLSDQERTYTIHIPVDSPVPATRLEQPAVPVSPAVAQRLPPPDLLMRQGVKSHFPLPSREADADMENQ